jgi:hypothetical protein
MAFNGATFFSDRSRIQSKLSVMLVCVLTLTAQQATALQLINLGPEYDAFVRNVDGQDTASVEAEWVKFESRYQEIYDSAVYRKSEAGWEKRLRQKRDKFFAQYKTSTPKMNELFDKAGQIVGEQ